jgi:hypothetical protein
MAATWKFGFATSHLRPGDLQLGSVVLRGVSQADAGDPRQVRQD